MAESLAEIADVAGLVTGIGGPAPIGEPDAAAPPGFERRERIFLGSRYLRNVGVAQYVEMETVGEAGGDQSLDHRSEIADHAIGRLVADAHQDRGRARDRLV